MDSARSVRRPSALGLNTILASQSVVGSKPDTSQGPPQIPMDGVLPSPAPSDDTPQIISISSTRRLSPERQKSRDPPDLDGMLGASTAQPPYLPDGSTQKILPTHQNATPSTKSATIVAQTTASVTPSTMPSAQTVTLPTQPVMSPTQVVVPSTPTASSVTQMIASSTPSIVPATYTSANPPEKRPAESEIASQPKRRTTDLGHWTPAQSASPRAPPMDSPILNVKLNWQALIHLLDVRQKSVKALGYQKLVLDNRFRLLREACELEDMAYLAMHQVFCVNDVLKSKSQASPIVAGIQFLSQLLLENDSFDKESLEWFSTFPSSFPISPDAYFLEYNAVQSRLKHIEQNWSPFQEYFITQRSPPLDIDIMVTLHVSSPILQRIMYRCISRAIWPPNPQDNCLQGYFDLFTRYQTDNRRLRFMPGFSDAERNRRLVANYQAQIRETQERLRLHQSHLTTQPHQASSSTIAVSGTPMNLPATTVVSSNAYPLNTTQGSTPFGFPPYMLSNNGQHIWYGNQQAYVSNQQSSSLPTSQPHLHSTQASGITSSSANNVNPFRRGPGRPRRNGTSQPGPSQPVSQPQRHNTLPSSSQSPSRFVTQTIPLQQQQQQYVRNDPHTQAQPIPVSLFRSIDYSGTPLHPLTSTLHQAHLEESAINVILQDENADITSSKHFHYLDSFALLPALIFPKDRNRRLNFTISNASFNHLAKPSKAYATTQLLLRPGSQTYRLRCVKVPRPDGMHFDKTGSLWSTLETYWPEFIVVMLNDRNLEIRRKEVHGKDHYIEISDFIREGENKLYISLLRSLVNLAKDSHTYAFAIEVLEIKSIDAARQESRHIAENITRDAIMSRLKVSDPDVEVISGEPIRISLIDPISLKLIASPVRGASCKHFDCFDLESFLSTRFDSSSPQCAKPEAFRCPICQGDARPMVLIHDDWQMGILRQYADPERKRGVTCIVVDDRGDWKFDVDKHDSGGKAASKVKSEEGDERDEVHGVIVLD